jgi:hypothetical protein
MTIRLYDSAWILFRDSEEPRQVLKDRDNPALFTVGGYSYDIDGRPYYIAEAAPDIVAMLNMQTARQLGLSTQYSAPKEIHI